MSIGLPVPIIKCGNNILCMFDCSLPVLCCLLWSERISYMVWSRHGDRMQWCLLEQSAMWIWRWWYTVFWRLSYFHHQGTSAKCLYPATGPHVTTQKTMLSILAALKTSPLMQCICPCRGKKQSRCCTLPLRSHLRINWAFRHLLIGCNPLILNQIDCCSWFDVNGTERLLCAVTGQFPWGFARLSEKQRVWNGVHSASWGQLRSYLKER
jgi:hypothetical protein